MARIRDYIAGTLFTGLSFLFGCADVDRPKPMENSGLTLENRIILNEGDDVNLGDEFMLCPWPPEVLKYIEKDTENKILKFIKSGTNPVTKECTYDDNESTNLIVNGRIHVIRLNSDGSLQVDLDANGLISKNNTFFVQTLAVDTHNKLSVGDYFLIKSPQGFMPYQYNAATWGPTQHEVSFDDIHNLLIRYHSLPDDNGQFKKQIDFNGTKVNVEMVGPNEEIKLSSFDGQNLECLVRGNIVANEGRSIKPGEHFLIDTTDSLSPEGEVWKYVGKEPADSILKFRKFGFSGFEYQDVILTNGEGMLYSGGFAYRTRFNAEDSSVNIDLDKSGFIAKNEVPLVHKYVFNEMRGVKCGEVFVLENFLATDELHVPARLSYVDTANNKIGLYNLNLDMSSEHVYEPTTGTGTAISGGHSYDFTVTAPDEIKIDLNGDGKIE